MSHATAVRFAAASIAGLVLGGAAVGTRAVMRSADIPRAATTYNEHEHASTETESHASAIVERVVSDCAEQPAGSTTVTIRNGRVLEATSLSGVELRCADKHIRDFVPPVLSYDGTVQWYAGANEAPRFPYPIPQPTLSTLTSSHFVGPTGLTADGVKATLQSGIKQPIPRYHFRFLDGEAVVVHPEPIDASGAPLCTAPPCRYSKEVPHPTGFFDLVEAAAKAALGGRKPTLFRTFVFFVSSYPLQSWGISSDPFPMMDADVGGNPSPLTLFSTQPTAYEITCALYLHSRIGSDPPVQVEVSSQTLDDHLRLANIGVMGL